MYDTTSFSQDLVNAGLSAAPHLPDTMRIQGSTTFAVEKIRLHIDLAYIPLPNWRRAWLTWKCIISSLDSGCESHFND